MTEPSPGYHGIRFYETFGDYGYMMKARVENLRDLGPALSPFNAFLFLQGLETLPCAWSGTSRNARAVAEFLAEHPLVSWVNYPALPDSPYHALAQKYLPQGRRRGLHLRRQGRARGRRALHRGAATDLAPGQRRRRQDAGDPPGQHDAPAD